MGYLALIVLVLAGLGWGGGTRAVAATTPTAKTVPMLKTPYPAELRSTGKANVPAIVIDFPDAPSTMTTAAVSGVLYGPGSSERAPFESVRAFYLRSSYDKLDISGELLGVYHAPTARSAIDQAAPGAAASLIADALRSFDARGTDFSRFDTDGDGRIDYLVVMWSGPAVRGGVWCASYTVGGSEVVVDGKTLGAYAWVPLPTDRSARTLVHETGHALGLADLYDTSGTLGPGGGVGAFDVMGGGTCDLNALSKIMLGWIRPRIVASGRQVLTLRPTSVAPDALIVMPRFSPASPYREFYVVQARVRSGNDETWPYERTAGLQVWHVDARRSASGRYVCNNSSTAHKFLSLEEADGLREIERFGISDAADLFHTGAVFSAVSRPSSQLYGGTRSGVTLTNVRAATTGVTFTAVAVTEPAPRGRQSRASGLARARALAARRR